MMLPRCSRLWALLCLFLCFNLAFAGVIGAARRDDSTSASTSEAAPSSTFTQATQSSHTATAAASSSAIVSASSTEIAPTPSPSPTSGGFNLTIFNNLTIPEGELPYTPLITPGWGVGGIILLITGILYALVGIKTQWIYTFFSAAYLAGVGTTVLILYVTPLPISNGVQGGLVVAAVCTGLLFGGVAIIFKDITECLGCLLGGFCFAMWLLTLQAGGLLPETGPKAALIAAFTLGAFALYFSHWTRTYGLIACSSFAGATATVLGIDCFSRAGLKEFWAYIWSLNDDIFPLGTVTYPLTRGIRVELAVTILIAAAGIVSQLRVWRIIQEHRSKRDAEKAEADRNLQLEEENIGRQVEAANDRERQQWERVYGDGQGSPLSADSGVGDLENEKQTPQDPRSASITPPRSTMGPYDPETTDGIAELPSEAPQPPPKPTAAEMVISQDSKDGVVTIRVAQDDVPNGHVYDASSGDEIQEQQQSIHMAMSPEAARAVGPAPNVTPLPFRVPETLVEDEEESERGNHDDRSSVATFADENGDEEPTAQEDRRRSLAKRLSTGSAELLRRVSQRSKSSRSNAKEAAPDNVGGESREELMQSLHRRRDDNDSVMANLDDLSSTEDANSVRDEPETRDIEITAELGDKEGKPEPDASSKVPAARGTAARASAAETVATDILNVPEPDGTPAQTLPPRNSTDKAGATVAASESDYARESGAKSTRGPKSTASSGSVPASLTKANLPRPLSRIALSYRTNEWAKHLSVADTPAPEMLQLVVYPDNAQQEKINEDAAPVHVNELKQTAETGALPPAAPRSESVLSHYGAQQALSRSNSAAPAFNLPQYQMALDPAAEPQSRNVSPSGPPPSFPSRPKPTGPKRRASALHTQAIAEEEMNEVESMGSGQEDSNPSLYNSVGPSAVPPELLAQASQSSMRQLVPGVVSYDFPQTLLGQREMRLRNKSHTSFIAPAQDSYFIMPAAAASRAPSDAGSIYNYPAYTPAPQPAAINMDDVPLSQRREMMRQMSLNARPASGMALHPTAMMSSPAVVIPTASADMAAFDSHQPNRDNSHIKSAEARQAQLRSFRNSVSAELRAEVPGLYGNASALSLPGDVRQSMQTSHNFLMGQRDAEIQRKEAERLEKEHGDARFEQMMRSSGAFQMAHREALRKLQGNAKDH